MGLRAQAAADAKAILESTDDFGDPFTLTDPVGIELSLVGFTQDIGQTIDPETGQAVSGRLGSACCHITALTELPRGVADETRKPWLVTFADLQGVVLDWKVMDVEVDRTLGVVKMKLEIYHAGAHY